MSFLPDWKYKCNQHIYEFQPTSGAGTQGTQLTNINQALCGKRNNSRKHTFYLYQRVVLDLGNPMSYKKPSLVHYERTAKKLNPANFYRCMILASWVTVRSRLAGSSEGSCLFTKRTKNGTPFWAS